MLVTMDLSKSFVQTGWITRTWLFPHYACRPHPNCFVRELLDHSLMVRASWQLKTTFRKKSTKLHQNPERNPLHRFWTDSKSSNPTKLCMNYSQVCEINRNRNMFRNHTCLKTMDCKSQNNLDLGCLRRPDYQILNRLTAGKSSACLIVTKYENFAWQRAQCITFRKVAKNLLASIV